jgi:hypothetical protein
MVRGAGIVLRVWVVEVLLWARLRLNWSWRWAQVPLWVVLGRLWSPAVVALLLPLQMVWGRPLAVRPNWNSRCWLGRFHVVDEFLDQPRSSSAVLLPWVPVRGVVLRVEVSLLPWALRRPNWNLRFRLGRFHVVDEFPGRLRSSSAVLMPVALGV